MVIGLPRVEHIEICEDCIYVKQTRSFLPVSRVKKVTSPWGLIHTDLCGPMQVESLSWSRYFYSLRMILAIWVGCILSKWNLRPSNASEVQALVENQSNNYIKTLQTDMGGEFMSWGFNLFYEENGIKRQYTPTYYPQQNSVAKRKNWTVIEMGRNLLTSKGLPNTIWA